MMNFTIFYKIFCVAFVAANMAFTEGMGKVCHLVSLTYDGRMVWALESEGSSECTQIAIGGHSSLERLPAQVLLFEKRYRLLTAGEDLQEVLNKTSKHIFNSRSGGHQDLSSEKNSFECRNENVSFPTTSNINNTANHSYGTTDPINQPAVSQAVTLSTNSKEDTTPTVTVGDTVASRGTTETTSHLDASQPGTSEEETTLAGTSENSSTTVLDINECNSNPCGVNEMCINQINRYICNCQQGFVTDNNMCIDINECGLSPCGTNANCENMPGSFTCRCMTGYSGDPMSQCTDVNECETLMPCDANAFCSNVEGSYTCTCMDGYAGDGVTCSDINECNSNPCGVNEMCVNQINRYDCDCQQGFVRDKNVCIDINECDDPQTCSANQMCENLPGSYTCSCMDGYKAAVNGNCVDFDECSDPTICDVSPNQFCVNLPGSYTCNCTSGFSRDASGTCQDTDECMSNPCTGESFMCVNVPGSYSCECIGGYSLNPETGNCEDTDECMSNPCTGESFMCVNVPGSYSCECIGGYSLNPETGNCEDTDECMSNPCTGESFMCVNVPGSYSCECIGGYSLNPGTGNCEDTDECMSNPCTGESFMCVNIPGSYSCECIGGYSLNPGTGNCEDTDECMSNPCTGESFMCVNVPGSYSCECIGRYSLNPGSGNCEGCSTNEVYGTCSCETSCGDPLGCLPCTQGRRCYCPSGFYLQGQDCVPQNECGCHIDRVIVPEGDTYVDSVCSQQCTCNNNQLTCNNNYECSPNAACSVENGVRKCYCNEDYEGDGETCTPLTYTDCYDAYQAGQRQDGVYTILPSGWPGSPFNVFCDMTTAGGGWTIFQRRIDGVTNFYRNWTEYKQGFGSVHQGTDFWLGNEQLHYLTNQKSYKLRVDIVDSGGTSRYSEYTTFQTGDESTKYRLTISGYSGNAGDGMYNADGGLFSTYDQDNDGCSHHDCAEAHRGAWWYDPPSYWCVECYTSYTYCRYFQTRSSCNNLCTYSNLNGNYNGGNGQNINWYNNNYCNLNSAEMKIRPSSA